MPPRKKKSTFTVARGDLIEFVKNILHEGNVRRIIIKDTKGKKYAEIPVTIGLIGFLMAPLLIAVLAMAAMVEFFEVEIVRRNRK